VRVHEAGGNGRGAAGKKERVKGRGAGNIGLGYLGLECFFLYLFFRFN
jgi:hypothetical protein